MNAHYTVDKICSLISLDPEPLSIYFTYEPLIPMLMNLVKHVWAAHIALV